MVEPTTCGAIRADVGYVSTLKTRIRVAQQECTSVDQMRETVRHAYKRASAQTTRGNGQTPPLSNADFVSNGDEDSSVEQMPKPVRQVHVEIVATANGPRGGIPHLLESCRQATAQGASSVAFGTTRPDSIRTWLFLTAVVLGLWLLAVFEFGG